MDELKTLLEDLALVRQGIVLAEAREKRPTYVMELRCVLETLDTIPDRVRALARTEMKGARHGIRDTTTDAE